MIILFFYFTSLSTFKADSQERTNIERYGHHDLGHTSSSNLSLLRRRPSLLPSSLPNEHSYTASILQSSLLNRRERERYSLFDFYLFT